MNMDTPHIVKFELERKSVTKTKYANILEYLIEVGMGI